MLVIKKGLQLSALAVSALLLADVAQAQQVARDPDDASAQGQKQQGRSRLRAPTQEEIATLLKGMEKSLSQSAEGLTVRTLPNGAIALDLEGRFESVALARIAPDGTVAAECVTNDSEARDFLSRDLAAAGVSSLGHSDSASHEHAAAPADKTPEHAPVSKQAPVLEEK